MPLVCVRYWILGFRGRADETGPVRRHAGSLPHSGWHGLNSSLLSPRRENDKQACSGPHDLLYRMDKTGLHL